MGARELPEVGMAEAQRATTAKIRAALLDRLARVGVGAGEVDSDERLPVVVAGADAPYVALADRVLVPADEAERAVEVLRPEGGAVVRLLEPLGIAELRLPGRDGLAAALARLRSADPPVAARPHHVLFGAAWWGRIREGDDPEQAPRLNPPDDTGDLPGTGVRVAVVDNGIAAEALRDPWLDDLTVAARDLDPKRVYEAQLHPPPGHPADTLDVGAGHGTLVTGIIRQVAPGCEVDVVRALDSDGVGTEEAIARGILRAVAGRASIINLSLGGYTENDRPPVLLAVALREVPSDAIVVAAAGNEGTDRPVWPGAIRRVVSVAATVQAGEDGGGATDELETWSNRGWWVDVAAPGTWVSTFVTGRENPLIETDGQPEQFTEPYARAGGTSFATASVTGALAVELARRGGSPRDALVRLRARAGNVRLPWGGVSLDVWDDATP
jgi:subtilisin family serine protease